MSQQNARELIIKRGNGASPEVFTHVCGIRDRTWSMSNAVIDTTVPSCEDPANPIVATGRPGRQDMTFSVDNGLFDSDAIGKLVAQDARTQATDVNYKVIVPGMGEWVGPFFVSNYSVSGGMEDPLAFSATWVPLSGDALTFTAEV